MHVANTKAASVDAKTRRDGDSSAILGNFSQLLITLTFIKNYLPINVSPNG